MATELLYRIQNVVFEYNGRPALRVPELDVFRGETLALVGPNGSGKTTLLKLLNDLLRPTSGSILYRGQPTGGNSELRIRSTYVHQSPFLFAGTVYRNVALGLKIRRMPKEEIRSRVSEVLELLGLSGFERRDAKRLSGGETQRVALARALAPRPDILLLDEPTAQADRASAEKIRSVLIDLLKKHGATVLLSSHDIAFAATLADRMAFLEEGLLEQVKSSPRLGAAPGPAGRDEGEAI